MCLISIVHYAHSIISFKTHHSPWVVIIIPIVPTATNSKIAKQLRRGDPLEVILSPKVTTEGCCPLSLPQSCWSDVLLKTLCGTVLFFFLSAGSQQPISSEVGQAHSVLSQTSMQWLKPPSFYEENWLWSCSVSSCLGRATAAGKGTQWVSTAVSGSWVLGGWREHSTHSRGLRGSGLMAKKDP